MRSLRSQSGDKRTTRNIGTSTKTQLIKSPLLCLTPHINIVSNQRKMIRLVVISDSTPSVLYDKYFFTHSLEPIRHSFKLTSYILPGDESICIMGIISD